ncbi:fluoride efflux transporter FluC [Quadrisphaera sp. KR29]|uniref:fluoride efflux transporter FluC n=1 Tax=Quadrisphaera sp. KR29 TaxID=3461391 RepID=UPI0040440FCF
MSGAVLALVVLGGAVGAPCRSWLDGVVAAGAARRRSRTRGPAAQPALPPGTLVVNLLGALVLGVLVGLAPDHSSTSRGALWLVAGATGFCGSFTTFSSAVVEAVRLAQVRRWGAAAATAAVHLAGSLAALAAGLAVGLALR